MTTTSTPEPTCEHLAYPGGWIVNRHLGQWRVVEPGGQRWKWMEFDAACDDAAESSRKWQQWRRRTEEE